MRLTGRVSFPSTKYHGYVEASMEENEEEEDEPTLADLDALVCPECEDLVCLRAEGTSSTTII
jgi:hypothetical protein